MARQDKSKSRITPKGTQSTAPAGTDAETAPSTAAIPPELPKPSAAWVPILMFGLLIVGVLMILLNYVAPIPGGPSNWYLLGGLGLVLGGIIAATQYR